MYQQNGDIKDFVSRNNIQLLVEKVDKNPNFISSSKEDEEWLKNANTYKCKLQLNKNSFVMYMSLHKTNTKIPTLEDVLDSQITESSCIDNSVGFEDWASDLGYNTDSRKAEKIYNICFEMRNQLERFLGKKRYHELLTEIERL